ncbi:glutathione S-transferase family protein [Pararobbsia alpina]|uniref:Glutathione S-transferase GST-6.0 n=1 Tax=Pararobbsia alpina TaxID=621374 RepID=A0A6S7BBS7_9BURK|nr:glutathione S-transferase [Pararobbsia alpina]CAB3783641.1 Glutathione S-transferase GST-6.0 [Pararobbsia alpina]
MKIYDFKGFANPARVRIAVAEKGLTDQIEFVHVDLPNGAHRTPEFFAKNPSGTVPVLELDDGTTISECTAITVYLDHVQGESTLTGRNGKERAIVHMMQRRAEAELMDALGTYFHHATPGLGAEIELYQNREWGEKNLKRAMAGMHYLNQVLSRQPYLAGESFSMVDITAFAGLGLADFLKIDVPDTLTNLQAWRARVAARPSIAASQA